MMRRHVSLTMIALGLLMALGGFGALVAPGAALAQSVPQPTARPPLQGEPTGDDDEDGGAVQMGHVTGTVIDSATGAPVPYAQVRVGDQVITADANGNYDLWVPTGQVTVSVAPSEANPNPEPYTVEVRAGEATVQHLVQPSAAPATAVAPTPEPAAVAAPVVKSARPALTADSAPVQPDRLPATASDTHDPFGAWFWVSMGIALLAGGVLVGQRADTLRAPAVALARYARSAGPAQRPAADAAALLAALLTSDVRSARSGEDPLLSALLAADARKRRAAQELLAELLGAR